MWNSLCRRHHRGSALIIVLALMAALTALSVVNAQSLAGLRHFLNRVEHEQTQKFSGAAQLPK